MKRIKKDVIKQIILENREFIKNIPDTFVERDCFRLPGKTKKVVILYGVRRCGKTYLLYHLMKKNIDCSLYIDFEDERLQGFGLEDFETLRECFFELFPTLVQKRVLFLFDEIQLIEGWEKFCRRLVERSQVEVIAAGSSSAIHPENISTTLRGRAWSIKVFPFSFKEFLAFEGFNVSPDTGLKSPDLRFKMIDFFSRYLKWGGFPEVVAAETEFEKRKIIREYLDAIFFKDLLERYEISNLNLLKSLKSKIFSTFSTKFSLTSFYNKVKGNFPFSKDSLYKYYRHLLDSGTAFEVRTFSDSEYKKVRNPGKVYIIDHALSNKVSHDDSARALENLVFIELLRRNYNPYYFFKTNECDFVAVNDGSKDVIQVTYVIEEGNRQRELNGIVEAAQTLRLKEGTIITYNDEDEIELEGIKIKLVPAWKWLTG